MCYLAASSSRSHSDSLSWRQISTPGEMEAAISIALRRVKKDRLSLDAWNVSTILLSFSKPWSFLV